MIKLLRLLFQTTTIELIVISLATSSLTLTFVIADRWLLTCSVFSWAHQRLIEYISLVVIDDFFVLSWREGFVWCECARLRHVTCGHDHFIWRGYTATSWSIDLDSEIWLLSCVDVAAVIIWWSLDCLGGCQATIEVTGEQGLRIFTVGQRIDLASCKSWENGTAICALQVEGSISTRMDCWRNFT